VSKITEKFGYEGGRGLALLSSLGNEVGRDLEERRRKKNILQGVRSNRSSPRFGQGGKESRGKNRKKKGSIIKRRKRGLAGETSN